MNIMGAIKSAGTIARGAGNVLGRSIMGQYGRTAQGAVVGGLWGGVLGGIRSNGSILGGAAKGAAVGAAFGRYGQEPLDKMGGLNSMWQYASTKGIGASAEALSMAYSKSVGQTILKDARSVKMAANKGFNRIKGIF
jgi:hypothetical protein